VNVGCSAYSWEEKLPASKSALENTWLYHEIGRCHLEMNHAGDASEYGDKSLEAATEAGDALWQLNACVLIAQSHGPYNPTSFLGQPFEKRFALCYCLGPSGHDTSRF